jgi:3-hydroxybutyrate dehydrogenase
VTALLAALATHRGVLAGKTAIVTGSTSGIGLSIAAAFAERGAAVVLNGLGDIDAARRHVERAAHARFDVPRVEYHPADMSRPDEIADLVHHAVREFGGVDILVNNAGIQHVASIEDFPVDRWDAIVAINLSAAFHTTRLVLPGMRTRNWGRIINIASVHGLVASSHKAAYVAAKHGLIGLTKVTALETARTNVTCNALCPGWVLTPLVQRQVDDRAARDNIVTDDAKLALLGEKQPSGNFVTAEHLAETAMFLCSDAASQVRGAAWSVDGGWVAQ